MFTSRIGFRLIGTTQRGLSGPPRPGFTLLELLVVVGIIGVALTLLMPAIQASREAARRNACTNNMKEIGLGLQNHHDARRYLPLLTTAANTDAAPAILTAGPPGSAASGYSWITKILPFMGETALYKNIATSSNRFATNPFAGTIMANGSNTAPTSGKINALYAGQVALKTLRCPSYVGRSYTTGYLSDSGTAATNLYSQTGYDSWGSAVTGMYVSNYAATAAVNWRCMSSSKTTTGTAGGDSAEPPDGAIVPPSASFPIGTGVNFRWITDGLSRTIAVVETREAYNSAWIDGTVNWVVPDSQNLSFMNSNNNDYWTIGAGGATSANAGPIPDPNVYYKADAFDGQNWSWGPSSAHSGGVIVHLYCDGGARNITDDIDPTTYIQLVSRAGGEPRVVACCEE